MTKLTSPIFTPADRQIFQAAFKLQTYHAIRRRRWEQTERIVSSKNDRGIVQAHGDLVALYQQVIRSMTDIQEGRNLL